MSTIKIKDKLSTDGGDTFIGEWKQITGYPEQHELPVTYKGRKFKLLIHRRLSKTYRLLLIEEYLLEELFENNDLKIEDLEEAKKKALEIGIPRIKYIVDYPNDWKCEKLKESIENYLDSLSKDSKSILRHLKDLRDLLVEYIETFQKTEQYKRLLVEAEEEARKELRKINETKDVFIGDVGLSTAETVELQHKMYVDIINYRGGKTLRECVDEANDPSRWRKSKRVGK